MHLKGSNTRQMFQRQKLATREKRRERSRRKDGARQTAQTGFMEKYDMADEKG